MASSYVSHKRKRGGEYTHGGTVPSANKLEDMRIQRVKSGVEFNRAAQQHRYDAAQRARVLHGRNPTPEELYGPDVTRRGPASREGMTMKETANSMWDARQASYTEWKTNALWAKATPAQRLSMMSTQTTHAGRVGGTNMMDDFIGRLTAADREFINNRYSSGDVTDYNSRKALEEIVQKMGDNPSPPPQTVAEQRSDAFMENIENSITEHDVNLQERIKQSQYRKTQARNKFWQSQKQQFEQKQYANRPKHQRIWDEFQSNNQQFENDTFARHKWETREWKQARQQYEQDKSFFEDYLGKKPDVMRPDVDLMRDFEEGYEDPHERELADMRERATDLRSQREMEQSRRLERAQGVDPEALEAHQRDNPFRRQDGAIHTEDDVGAFKDFMGGGEEGIFEGLPTMSETELRVGMAKSTPNEIMVNAGGLVGNVLGSYVGGKAEQAAKPYLDEGVLGEIEGTAINAGTTAAITSGFTGALGGVGAGVGTFLPVAVGSAVGIGAAKLTDLAMTEILESAGASKEQVRVGSELTSAAVGGGLGTIAGAAMTGASLGPLGFLGGAVIGLAAAGLGELYRHQKSTWNGGAQDTAERKAYMRTHLGATPDTIFPPNYKEIVMAQQKKKKAILDSGILQRWQRQGKHIGYMAQHLEEQLKNVHDDHDMLQIVLPDVDKLERDLSTMHTLDAYNTYKKRSEGTVYMNKHFEAAEGLLGFQDIGNVLYSMKQDLQEGDIEELTTMLTPPNTPPTKPPRPSTPSPEMPDHPITHRNGEPEHRQGDEQVQTDPPPPETVQPPPAGVVTVTDDQPPGEDEPWDGQLVIPPEYMEKYSSNFYNPVGDDDDDTPTPVGMLDVDTIPTAVGAMDGDDEPAQVGPAADFDAQYMGYSQVS
jgi:hypothetical protein